MKKSFLSAVILSALSLSSFAFANQAGDFVVRGGLTNINPDNNTSSVNIAALGGKTPLSLSVDDNTQLGLNFVYFYDNNWAIEVLAATPYSHDVIINDPQGIAPGVLGAAVDGATLAEVTHLPPTISALYYFDSSSNLKPYVGVGVNYTIFWDEEFKSAPKSLGFKDLDLDGSFGFSWQVGADYYFDDNWSINATVQFIDIDSEAKFKIGDTITGKSDVNIDPMVYSIMLGYKF
jgi:outer membrane protein